MMKMFKILFLNTLVIGTLIAISSYSWMGMWIGLEINLLSIIPLMSSNKISYSSESSLKYFMTQSLASTIFLFSIIMMYMNLDIIPMSKSTYMMMMNFSLLTKMGAAPFHFWFPEIMNGLDWFNSFLILTWQKIAPMMILFTNLYSLKLMYIVILSSMIIGGVMGLNQMSIRKILAYSSINHMGWMLAALMTNFFTWLIYFTIYSLISLMLIIMFHNSSIMNFNQLILNQKFNTMEKFSINLNLLSMGGLPPFLGFFPKWLVINQLSENKMITILIFMVLLTLITLFYYIRLIISSLSLNYTQISFQMNLNNLSFIFYFTNFLNLLGLMIMILLFKYI
uniref:NADH-ubiquinone oxidoreductase chain 2 n=1 Tax=Anobiinae sp. GENSP01 TaxID=1205538 RepID=A0A0S2MN67_9COLE|nr:NADH deshydrogenase subunit 2 [Anobiinae sp. GENSP01]